MANQDSVIGWLLTSDASVRWQTMRDLLDAPEHEWSGERAKVETEGWGAQLLSHQDEDGQWAGAAFCPKNVSIDEFTKAQPWTATCHVLEQLQELGLDPASARAQRTVQQVGQNARWDEGQQPFWEGETEECINGRTVASGAYFGANVRPIVERLLAQRQADGGWNCERPNGSVRSSFATTINVLEGLLEYERATGGTPESATARMAGEEYLLSRHLFRRLSTGEPADDKFLLLLHPSRWHYDILRALDYFWAAAAVKSGKPDPRLEEAVEHLRSKRRNDGRWALDWQLPGRAWVQVDDGPGQPSPFLTLKARRVLKWWDGNRRG